MEKKLEYINNEIGALTKRLNSFNEGRENVSFTDFVRSCGSDVILLEEQIKTLTIIRDSLQSNPTQDMFDRQYKSICRLAMNTTGFSSGAFTHPVEVIRNNAVKEVYKFLTYLE